MAAEFRASFDEIARQSELDDLRREVEAMRAGVTFPGAVGAVAGGEAKQAFEDIHAGLHDTHAVLTEAEPSLPFGETHAAAEEAVQSVKAPS